MNSKRAWNNRGQTRYPSVGSILCRVGLHKWSDHKGGIQVCTRDHCQRARTFGLTGTMRRLEWEEQLYEQYHELTEETMKSDSYLCPNEDCGAHGEIREVGTANEGREPKYCPYCGGHL